MDIKKLVTYDTITTDGRFSVRKQAYVENGDEIEYVGEPERRAFCPGQFEELSEYAPELMERAAEIWTPKVVAAWQQRQAEMQE